MDAQQEQQIHEAVEAALDALAERLGGTVETGGPVVNATQIKGRSDLGILLTDADDRVLGRVWVAFGGALHASEEGVLGGGNVEVQAEVCSELIEPPVHVDAWFESAQHAS